MDEQRPASGPPLNQNARMGTLYESYVASLFEQRGFRVARPGGNTGKHTSGDFGADILVYDARDLAGDRPLYVVQCKYYDADTTIGVDDVYPVVSAMLFYGAGGAVLCSNRSLGDKAKAVVDKVGLQVERLDPMDWSARLSLAPPTAPKEPALVEERPLHYLVYVTGLLMQKGFRVERIPPSHEYLGADLLAYGQDMGDERPIYAVQCRYHAEDVRRDAVQAVVTAALFYGASGPVLMTNRPLETSAADLAARTGVRVELLDTDTWSNELSIAPPQAPDPITQAPEGEPTLEPLPSETDAVMEPEAPDQPDNPPAPADQADEVVGPAAKLYGTGPTQPPSPATPSEPLPSRATRRYSAHGLRQDAVVGIVVVAVVVVGLVASLAAGQAHLRAAAASPASQPQAHSAPGSAQASAGQPTPQTVSSTATPARTSTTTEASTPSGTPSSGPVQQPPVPPPSAPPPSETPPVGGFPSCPPGQAPAVNDATGLCMSGDLPASCRSPQTQACLSFLRMAQAIIGCYIRNGGYPTGAGLSESTATACEMDPSYTAPPPGTILPPGTPTYGG